MNLNTLLIRESFQKIETSANEAIDYFFGILFEAHPELRELFVRSDLDALKRPMISSLGRIIDLLDNSESLDPYLKQLRQYHITLGFQPNHYEMIGKCLMLTFRHFFGATWSPDVEDQWIAAYEGVTQKMLKSQISSERAGEDAEESGEIMKASRAYAKELLIESLDLEADEEFKMLARKKARSILLQALHDETEATRARILKKVS
jgi:methyl-accepting chemotaxis protein